MMFPQDFIRIGVSPVCACVALCVPCAARSRRRNDCANAVVVVVVVVWRDTYTLNEEKVELQKKKIIIKR
jgi:hypothetical protein